MCQCSACHKWGNWLELNGSRSVSLSSLSSASSPLLDFHNYNSDNIIQDVTVPPVLGRETIHSSSSSWMSWPGNTAWLFRSIPSWRAHHKHSDTAPWEAGIGDRGLFPVKIALAQGSFKFLARGIGRWLAVLKGVLTGTPLHGLSFELRGGVQRSYSHTGLMLGWGSRHSRHNSLPFWKDPEAAEVQLKHQHPH